MTEQPLNHKLTAILKKTLALCGVQSVHTPIPTQLGLLLRRAIRPSQSHLWWLVRGTQTPDGAKTAAGNPKSKQASATKTRTASCNCGQLRVTCKGPDPDRVVMCNCYLCQKQTGSPFSLQARFPNEQVTIEGKSTAWKFPIDGAKPTPYSTCAGSDGIATDSAADLVTSHFCPVCGSTVYYFRKSDPARTGVRVGAFADPKFPPPMGSGFEEYAHPWVMNLAALPMPLGHHK